MTSNKMNEYEQKSFKEVQDAMEVIINNLNHMGIEQNVSKAIINILEHTHPTLKQNFFKHVVLESIKYFDDLHKKNSYDLRDEASCLTATELMPIVDKAMIPFI